MIRKKTVKKISIKKIKNKRTIIVESIVSAKDTLFPEKLKQANEFLAQIKDSPFLKSSHNH
ncbi:MULTISPECIES: hypothetical protein [Niastella]|uniref:Uncharacterized protein n=1 Tax=Niastella soli TaxID=2821487 RepID=A0ABS3YPB2_9BACT|nr:hypothetical protein [Niastella soli]MBO9199725.1 hypothetical protein [Niastella soli]